MSNHVANSGVVQEELSLCGESLPNVNHLNLHMEETRTSASWHKGIPIVVTSELVNVLQRVNHRAYVFHFEIICEALGFIDDGVDVSQDDFMQILVSICPL
jgi:hypothetical protein